MSSSIQVDTENSFEALASDSDDDSNYEEDWETDSPEDAVQDNLTDKGDTDSDKSDAWEVPGECCERQCTARMRRCFTVAQREFNLEFDTDIELKVGPASTDAEEVEPPPEAVPPAEADASDAAAAAAPTDAAPQPAAESDAPVQVNDDANEHPGAVDAD